MYETDIDLTALGLERKSLSGLTLTKANDALVKSRLGLGTGICHEQMREVTSATHVVDKRRKIRQYGKDLFD